MHTSKGTVESIDRDHRGKTVTVTVSHGKRKRRTGGPDSEVGQLDGYNRPTSRFTLPATHAKHYTVGQRVECGIGKCSDGDTDDMGETPAPAPAAKKAAPPKSAKKGPASKGRGRIFAAMTKGKK